MLVGHTRDERISWTRNNKLSEFCFVKCGGLVKLSHACNGQHSFTLYFRYLFVYLLLNICQMTCSGWLLISWFAIFTMFRNDIHVSMILFVAISSVISIEFHSRLLKQMKLQYIWNKSIKKKEKEKGKKAYSSLFIKQLFLIIQTCFSFLFVFSFNLFWFHGLLVIYIYTHTQFSNMLWL